MQIQSSWLLQKPTDLDLLCLQRQDISGFSRTRVNINDNAFENKWIRMPDACYQLPGHAQAGGEHIRYFVRSRALFFEETLKEQKDSEVIKLILATYAVYGYMAKCH